MTFKQMQFATILFGLGKAINRTAQKYPAFKERLEEKNFTAQIKIVDDSVGRYFTFDNGKIFSRRGIHASPDICLMFKDAKRPAVEPRESQAWEENGFLFSFHAENRSRL